METIKVISGHTEQELWPEIETDLASGDVYDYNVLIKQGDSEISLQVDIDLGGGFEGGWEYTILKAPLMPANDFKFAIHDETFIDKVGKFFGMQDIKTGYDELDRHLIIKTNDENKVRRIFDNAGVRTFFTSLNNFHCGIHTHHADNGSNEQPYLELNIDEGINEATALKNVYHAFYTLLTTIEQNSSKG